MSATATTLEQTPAHERYVERARDRDEPTRSKTIRKRYAQRLRGRLADIRAAIREGIVENDALGLQTEALVDAPAGGQFDFTTDSEKVAAFERWLQRQLDREVLQEFGGQNQFIEQAYLKGLEEAQTELSSLGVGGEVQAQQSIRMPVHQSQLEAMFTRNLSELEGITSDISRNLRRRLTEGLARGDNPRTIARDLTDVLGKVEDGTPRAAMNRATRLARTEVMANNNRARAVEWSRAGVEQVDIILANGACSVCRSLAANAPYSVEEGRALIPGRTHPNCRCALTVHID